MAAFRCDWCGRFYSDPTPDGSACPDHVYLHNERLTRRIAEVNAKLAEILTKRAAGRRE